jgi:dihydroneopterin aldolase
MTLTATVELTDLHLPVDLGTYGPDDLVPDHHLLDLTLEIPATRVFIATDEMAAVFDYDPLIVDIDRLARDGHYETQERLMTRIVEACAAYADILAVEVHLRKRPVRDGTGALGVRLRVPASDLAELRHRLA